MVDGDKDAFRVTGGQEQKDGEMAMKGWLEKIEEVKEEAAVDVIVVDDEVEEKGKGKEKEKKAERLLVVVGTYSIGKER